MIDALSVRGKHTAFLWLSGFREACSLHRALFFCTRSRKLAVRTGQCFLLNGFIFLGSIFLLNSVITPILFSILPHDCRQLSSSVPCHFQRTLKLYAFLRSLLIEIFYVLWFYPLYIFSFILSSIWYNDIAHQALEVMKDTSHAKKHHELSSTSSAAPVDKREGFEGSVIGLAEQIYSVLLLIFFFIEVSFVGLLPYIGVPAKFVLLSWMYSYYCFEYKWNHAVFGCKERLELFHTNWAFFAGFGSPCVVAMFFFSPLVSGGVMAILFPLVWEALHAVPFMNELNNVRVCAFSNWHSGKASNSLLQKTVGKQGTSEDPSVPCCRCVSVYGWVALSLGALGFNSTGVNPWLANNVGLATLFRTYLSEQVRQQGTLRKLVL